MFKRMGRCKSVFIGMTVLAALMATPLTYPLAAIISTEAFRSDPDSGQFKTRLIHLLAREDVRAALLQHGIAPAEVEARITALTDGDISENCGRMTELPAGGQAAAYIPIWLVLLILLGYILVLTGVISLGAYAGVKIQEAQEAEYAQSTPYPAPPRVGPLPGVDPDEPWTGVWKVADGRASGVYVLKQTGDAVVSTPESDFKVDAKVFGATISGTSFDTTRNSFKALIADDYLSFKGDLNSRTFFTATKVDPGQAINKPGPSGPWAGKWNVQGSPFASGLWVLKQEGETVTSTGESYYRVNGKGVGDSFEGEVLRLGPARTDLKFSIVLSSDGKSFSGHMTGEKGGVSQIHGAKID